MTPSSDMQYRLRRYLLGQIDEDAREEIEKALLTNGEEFEELLALEDELVDDYVAGNLSAADRTAFENHFLATPERTSQLRFGRAFNHYLSSHAKPVVLQETKSTGWWSSPRAFLHSPWRAVAFAAVALVVAFGAWQIFVRQSPVDEGLLALNSAFREQRPLESRISNLDYAPYVVTRGPEDDKTNQEELQRAELTLLNAQQRNATPAVLHALGKVYLAKKDFDKAIEKFNEALKGAPNNAQLHSDLGAAWLEKGKLDRQGAEPSKGLIELGRSLESLNKAVELNPNLLEALFNRALCHEYMMSSREAEASWKEYLQKDQSSPWAADAKRHLKELQANNARTSWNTGNAVQDFIAAHARNDSEKAWSVVTQNYTSGGNQVTNSLVDALVDGTGIENPASALSFLARLELDRAGDRFTSDMVDQLKPEAPKRRQLLIEALRNMRDGYDLFIKSRFEPAIVKYSEAKRTYEALGNLTDQVFTEYRLAHCYLFLKDLKQAELMFKRLSVICSKREYGWLNAQCLYCLSHANYDQSHFSQAINYSEGALTRYERAADLNGAVKALTQLAQANQVLNRMGRAFQYLDKALALSINSPVEPMAKWGMLLQIALDMRSQGLHQAALIYQREALHVALEMERPLITSRTYSNLGFELAALKKFDEAKEAVRRAEETGEALKENPGGREIVAHASQQLGEIYRQSGECTKAIQSYDKSIDIYSQLNRDYYSFAARKGKLFCFIVNNDDRSAAEELPTVLALFDEYRPKITDENQRVSFFANQQNVYDLAIYYEFVRRQDVNKAFEYSEDSRARALLEAIREGAKVSKKNDEPQVYLGAVSRSMSLDEIQKKMPANAQILQYAVLDDRLLMWVLTPSAIQRKEVKISAGELKEKVQSFFETVDAPSSANPTARAHAGEDLYRTLIAPVESWLDKSRYLCIVPDKFLNYVPYQALTSPASGRFLIEDYNLGTAPSATIFVDLSESAHAKGARSDEQLLSVGNPQFNRTDFEALDDLPAAATEAKAVASLYAARNPLLRAAATETAVRSQIERADVVHLAMHYIVNDQMEILSGFPLAPEGNREQDAANGFLQSYEIYSLRLARMRLAVLSACETAIGRQYAGEGAIGAARPFMIAGVPTVVATLWRVDSEASAELMTIFHTHRTRDHLPASEALRRAQIEMARGDDAQHRHPYYWAAFQTIGGLSTY